MTPAQFRAALARGTAPVKARLLDQEAIAGVGNLLADQVLWLAKVNPARPVDELTPAEVGRLLPGGPARRRPRPSTAAACTRCRWSPFRAAGRRARADGAPMVRGTVGGRTTWWCSREQA